MGANESKANKKTKKTINFSNQFADDKPVDSNKKYWYCDTPKAKCKGFTELMKKIILRQKLTERDFEDTSANRQNEHGVTALMLACLYCPSEGDPVANVKILLKFHAYVNLLSTGGKTALICAVQNENRQAAVDIVKLLLEHRADVNIRTIPDNQTPLI
jgi:hypothetical protein